MKRHLAVIGFAMFFSLSSIADPAPTISAPLAHQRTQSGELTLIDVREPHEWASTGLPQGAVGATLQDEDFVDQVLAAVGGDKSAPIALSCRTGRRSERAAKVLSEAGFTDVSNLREGFVGRTGSGPGWKARGLPVESYNVD